MRVPIPADRGILGSVRRIPKSLLLLVLLAALASGAGSSGVRVQDPYAGGRGRWYRGQLHAHSTVHKYWCHPDSLKDKVQRYRDAGFDFVCISDHNFIGPSPSTPYAVLPTRDPHVPGICFISGAEIGFYLQPIDEGTHTLGLPRVPHVGGVGMDWSVSRGDSLFRLAATDSSTLQAAVDSIHTMAYAPGKAALAIVNHPEMVSSLGDGRLFPSDLRDLRGAVGVEVFNTMWSRARPGGRSWQHLGASAWDFVLLHADGPQWGFAVDDAHAYIPGQDFLGGWVAVQAESLGTVPLLDAIRAGRFVACVDSCAGAACDTSSAVFTALGAHGRTIFAASDRATEFTWWTDAGQLVRRVAGVRRDEYRVDGWERYVRLRIRNTAGAAYSQPFFVESPERDRDRWRLRPEGATRLLLHFDEGAGPVAHDASGQGHDLLLTAAPPPPASEWQTLADTTSYRDAPYGGWLPNGVGTTPDETDLDRDREGYAISCHGRSLHGEILVTPASSLLVRDATTLEWIGRTTARTELEQPLIVNEGRDESGRATGWRLVAAETGARDPWRFRFASRGDEREAHEVAFGADLDADVHLFALVLEDRPAGARVTVYADGRKCAGETFPGARTAWRADDAPDAPPLAVFEDPSGTPTPVFAYLRELRLTRGSRSEAAIRSDARRLGYLP
ncbi:MAG: hypothetical protein U0167_18275 [bacterium]